MHIATARKGMKWKKQMSYFETLLMATKARKLKRQEDKNRFVTTDLGLYVAEFKGGGRYKTSLR